MRSTHPSAGIDHSAGRRSVLTAAGREALPERTRLMWAAAVVLTLHAAAASLLVAGRIGGAAGVVTVGAVVLAYLAGLKHHADADHLTGIAGATRKFVAEGRSPVSVGLAFSLGHSSVVLVTAGAVIAGVGSVRGLLTGESTAAAALGVTGGLVAGTFLTLIGVFNLVVLTRILAARRGARHTPTVGGTAMGRLMARPLSRVRGPRHVYLVGFLFGLGFDTATQIGLLVLTATSAALGASVVALLALPLAFAAGMTLGDTVVGYVLMRTYRRAGSVAGSRVDAVVTGMSVASALTLGVIILGATLHEAGWLTGPVTTALAGLDLDAAGWVILGVVAATGLAVAALPAGRGPGVAVRD